MSKLRKWTSFVLCVLLVGALLVGCGDDTKQNDQPNKPGTTQGTEDPSGQQNTPADSAKKLELETPVGTLTFPEEWAGDVQTKDTSADGTYAMSFYGTVNGADVLLFEIAIGAAEGGYQLGSAGHGPHQHPAGVRERADLSTPAGGRLPVGELIKDDECQEKAWRTVLSFGR